MSKLGVTILILYVLAWVAFGALVDIYVVFFK